MPLLLTPSEGPTTPGKFRLRLLDFDLAAPCLPLTAYPLTLLREPSSLPLLLTTECRRCCHPRGWSRCRYCFPQEQSVSLWVDAGGSLEDGALGAMALVAGPIPRG